MIKFIDIPNKRSELLALAKMSIKSNFLNTTQFADNAAKAYRAVRTPNFWQQIKHRPCPIEDKEKFTKLCEEKANKSAVRLKLWQSAGWAINALYQGNATYNDFIALQRVTKGSPAVTKLLAGVEPPPQNEFNNNNAF